jgi:hypothetical protein
MKKLSIFSIFIYLTICGNMAWTQNIKPGFINGVYQLANFGETNSVSTAKETLLKAVDIIKKRGGGLLFITEKTCQDFNVCSSATIQNKLNDTAVILLDIRQGKMRFLMPSLGFRLPNSPVGYASVFLDREVKQDAININGNNTILRVDNRVVRGSSSYFQVPLQTKKIANDQQRIYVPTIAGLYVGQEFFAMIGKGYTGTTGEFASNYKVTIKVNKLGWDKKLKKYYLDASKLENNLEWGQIVALMNKSTTSAIMINDSIHSDLESPGSLSISKKFYAQGDCFGIGMHLKYMGNIMSTRGDEGGNAYNVDIWQMLDSFLGKVESWDPTTHTMVYTADSIRANTLGTSRLMINLNPEKWLTQGKISIESKYLPGGRIDPHAYVKGIDTNWSVDIVGRAFAVDEKEEYAGSGNGSFWKHGLRGRIVRRWWQITHYEKTPQGEDRLWVERINHSVFDHAVPTLINEKNYHKPMKYIIAPCAMVNDISNALLKEKKMQIKAQSIMPGPDDKRTIILSPAAVDKTKFDFAPGDPIEQAVGSDPRHPNGYRVRHREAMPSADEGASFLAQNNGAYPVSAGLKIFGAHDKMQIAGHSKFFHGIDINATCDYGLRIRRKTKRAAIMLENNKSGDAQKIIWQNKNSQRQTELYTTPDDGLLNIKGTGLSLNKTPLCGVNGISNGSILANNLRGINVKVPAHTKEVNIQFKKPEKDADYAIIVQVSWLTLHAVCEKTSTGFKVLINTPSSQDSTLDWMLIR